MNLQASPDPNPVNKRAAWRPLICLTAAAIALFQALLWCAPGVVDAEPSFAGQVFPWVRVVRKAALHQLQQQPVNAVRVWGFLAVCALLFAVYAAALRAVRDRQSVKVERFIFAAGALFQALYIFAPIMLSSDLYAYVVYGRAVSVHHANPYVENCPVPAGDPFLPLFGNWIPSWYGPLWTWFCGGITWFTGNHVGLTVLVFRLLAIAAMLATAALLWAVLQRTRPERAAQGLVFFLWNPLVVIETGLSGHNDGFMLIFLALGLWLHLRGWKACAVLALTLSAMLKFVTGMFIPLYVLMVLRQCATWRERAIFAVRGALLAGALVAGVRAIAPEETGSATVQSVFSADFYENNFHELLFNGLRRALGEDAEDVALPRSFQGYWVGTKSVTALRAGQSGNSAQLRQLPASSGLLLLGPQETEWLRVLDPVSHQRGYVEDSTVDEIDRPDIAEADTAEVRDLEELVTERSTARQANVILRLVMWMFMIGIGSVAAWNAADFPRFLTWSAIAMLAALFLIITEIRPWYLNWALAIATVAPSRMPGRLAALLSAGALTLYFSLCFSGGDQGWITTWRSVPAFVVPLAIIAVMLARQSMTSDAKSV